MNCTKNFKQTRFNCLIQKGGCIRNSLCFYPNFPLKLPQISRYFTLCHQLKSWIDKLFSRGGLVCPLHRWSASHVAVMAQHATKARYKNGGNQSTSAPSALCLELPLFQDGFPHRNGVLIIQHLQKDYRAYYNFLNFMSNIGDPQNIFFIYFPLWFQLNQTVGTKMIWVAVIGDWFNLIFKW